MVIIGDFCVLLQTKSQIVLRTIMALAQLHEMAFLGATADYVSASWRQRPEPSDGRHRVGNGLLESGRRMPCGVGQAAIPVPVGAGSHINLTGDYVWSLDDEGRYRAAADVKDR